MHPRANDQVQLAQPIPERDSPAVINVLADDETHPIILIANDNYIKLARRVTQRLPNKLFKLTASSRKIRAGRATRDASLCWCGRSLTLLRWADVWRSRGLSDVNVDDMGARDEGHHPRKARRRSLRSAVACLTSDG